MTTIHECGTVLSEKEKKLLKRKAGSMEAQIANFFNCTSKGYTAEEIHAALFPFGLLTSVRRSLTNLMNEGFLQKEADDKKRMGSRRVRIHTYSRLIINGQQKLF